VRGCLAALVPIGLLAVLHLLVWRTRRPRRQYRALAALAALALALTVAVGLVATRLGALPPFGPRDALDAIVLFAAAAIAYMVTYPPVQADSPSMTILLEIDRAGDRGLSRGELTHVEALSDAALILPRLADLVTGRLATSERGRYVIASRGARLARFYVRYRAVLGMEKGG